MEEEELDSRNAAIEKANGGNADELFHSPTGLRHKRPREPSGDHEEASPPGSGAKRRRSGAVPSVNWNAGTKAAIRTRLQRRANAVVRKTKSAKTERQMLAFDESERCRKILFRLEKAMAAIPPDSLNTVEYDTIQAEIQNTNLDLQYCLNFPWTKEYERLFSDGDIDTVSRNPRQPMLNVVDQCIQDGTLDELRAGVLDSQLAEKGINLQPRQPSVPQPQAFVGTSQDKQAYIHDSVLSAQDDALALSADKDQKQDDLEVERNTPQNVRPTVTIPSEEPMPEHEANVSPTAELPLHPEPVSYAYQESDGSEGGVMLNLTINDHESGEISETSSQGEHDTYNEEASSRDTSQAPQEYPIDIRGDANSSPEDAMQDYANADQAINFDGAHSQIERNHMQSSHQPSTLADLSEEDLRDQIRYFFTIQDPQTINFKAILVRCLVCSNGGHMAANCPRLNCADCGTYNDHFPPFCPKTKKCPRCRGPGHDEDHCKSRLKMLSSEIICDLCFKNGHTEDDCELVWRTSGLPGAIDMNNDRLKYVSCYECGKRAHLGNNCPLRRPGKPMGTTTWSMVQSLNQSSENYLSIRSKGELSIKGRAQKQQSMSLDSISDDEISSFVRPKVPAPAKTGRIRIQAPRHNARGTNQKPPASQYAQYQEYNSYGSSAQPVTSPQYAGKSNNSRAYASQPPLPQEPPPHGTPHYYDYGGQSYRPLPSAGQNAWRQFRS